MQVKRFEAETIQEALDNIKRELGPEAIILQTRKNRKGFGIMNKPSVEVTAAVSERAIQKKQGLDKRLPEESKKAVREMSATKQADIYNKYTEKHLEKAQVTRDKVEMSQNAKKITATRYADILDESKQQQSQQRQSRRDAEPVLKSPDIYTGKKEQEPVLDSPKEQSLEEQIRALKQVVDDLRKDKNSGDPLSNEPFSLSTLGGGNSLGNQSRENFALEEVFEQLVINGVERRYALSLIKRLRFSHEESDWNDTQQALDYLAEEMMDTVDVSSLWKQILPSIQEKQAGSPAALALIGPTGVGKTTTLAKIASEASNHRNLKVGLINLDHQKVGAFDQLATLAKILGVPFRSAATPDDLRAVLLDFKDFDLILLDAAGYSQRDTTSLKQLQETLALIPGLQKFLVLSATTRESELYDTINRFSLLNPKGLIVSKLDEAVVYGSIYNVSQRSKLPLVYFTTGQTVPDDIEEATRERLVSLIMDIE